MSLRRPIWLVVPLFAAVLFPAVTTAEDEPAIEPRVAELLQELGEYLTSHEQYTFEADITFDEVLPTGQKVQYGAVNEIAVRRPDRFRADYDGDLRNTRAWYDGEKITLMHVDTNLYAQADVPATIEEALDHIVAEYGFTLPLSDLLYRDFHLGLLKQVDSAFYMGLHMVDGVLCHHIAVSQANIDWQAWIEDGKQLVPRKIVLTYKREFGSPQYTAVLSNWDLSPKLPDRLFKFEAPPGAEMIEFMPAEDQRRKAPEPEQEP